MKHSREATPTKSVLFLVLLMNYENVDSEIVQRPSDATGMVNGSTYFNCSTSIRPIEKTVIWFHFPLDAGGDRKYVYDDGRIMTGYKGRFDIEIDNSTGEFNLLIKRLEMEDAGKYECKDDSHTDIGASADLTVLGSYPVCDSDMAPGGVVGPIQCEKTSAPDDVELSCGVTYNGKTAPELVWRRAGDSSNSTDTHCVTGYNRVTCNTTLTANLQLNGSVYLCEVNTQHNHCSLKINTVLYAFSNAIKREYYTGNEVTCVANASRQLSCSYIWYKDYRLTASYLGKLIPTDNGLYRCEAECLIRNDSCKFTAMVINVSTVSVPGQTYLLHAILWPIITFAGACILLVILCRLGVLCPGCRQRRRNEFSQNHVLRDCR